MKMKNLFILIGFMISFQALSNYQLGKLIEDFESINISPQQQYLDSCNSILGSSSFCDKNQLVINIMQESLNKETELKVQLKKIYSEQDEFIENCFGEKDGDDIIGKWSFSVCRKYFEIVYSFKEQKVSDLLSSYYQSLSPISKFIKAHIELNKEPLSKANIPINSWGLEVSDLKDVRLQNGHFFINAYFEDWMNMAKDTISNKDNDSYNREVQGQKFKFLMENFVEINQELCNDRQ